MEFNDSFVESLDLDEDDRSRTTATRLRIQGYVDSGHRGPFEDMAIWVRDHL